MNEDELRQKTQAKIEELKLKRTPQNIKSSNQGSTPFEQAYNEVTQILAKYNLLPDEAYLLGAHIQLLSTNVKLQHIMMAGQKVELTPEEKDALKKQKEAEEGKVRVKPDGE